MASGPEETSYEKMPSFATTKGPMYETKVSALLFLRGINSGLDFQLATNVKGAGALDDVVFRIKNPSGAWTSFFIQLKHKTSAFLSRKMLIHPQGGFSLTKYYNSYVEIKSAMSQTTTETTILFDGVIDDSIFVIFTNAKPSQDLGAARCAAEQVAEFLGSSSGKVFSFDPDGQGEAEKAITTSLTDSFGDGGRDFLERLRIFAAQPSEAECDALIKEELRKAVSAKSTDIEMDRLCVCFVENVKIWAENSKTLLHKGSDIFASARDRVLAESFSLVEVVANRLELVFEEAALSPLTEVLSGDFPVVCVRSSEQTSRLTCTKLLQALDLFLISHLFLGSKRFLENQDAVMSEWARGQHNTLVVSVNNRDTVSDERHFKQILELFESVAQSKKKLVILSTVKCEAVSDVKRLEDSFEWSSLAKLSRNFILKTEVMLQGHRISLETFLENQWDDYSDVLSASSVVEIMETKPIFSMGTVLANTDKHYIPRSLEKISTHVTEYMRQENDRLETTAILNMTLSDVVNTFYSTNTPLNQLRVTNTLQNFLDSFPLSHRHETTFVGETCALGSTTANFVGVSPDKATALWVRPFNRGWTLCILQGASENDVSRLAQCYKWKHTSWLENGKAKYDLASGNHDYIRKHVGVIRPENVMEVQERAVIVCGEPGMGKSTLMKYLGKMTKEAYPHLWVILVALNDHAQLFADGKHEDAIGFLLEATKTESPLQRLMLKSALEATGNVVVILDGYDEIVPKYSKQCCQLLSNLLETKAKRIWITTRLAVKEELESHMSTIAARLRQFNEEDQRCFLKRYWEDARESALPAGGKPLSDKELDDFIVQILSLSRSIGGQNDFLGVPLQAQMMAEVFVDHVTRPSKTQTLPEALDMLQLMDMFIEKKLEVYIQSKLKIKPSDANYDSILSDNKPKCLANHVEASLQVLRDSRGDILPKRTPTQDFAGFIQKVESGENKTGLIDGVFNGKVNFVHRVYAEYFVATWLAENLPEYAKCIMGSIFFDDAEGVSVVSRRLCDLMLAKGCDLHTAVLNGDVAKVKRLLASGADVNAVDRGGRSPLHLTATAGFGLQTEATHVEIMYLLINSPGIDLNVKDGLLNFSALQHAAINLYWLMVDKLLGHDAEPEDVRACFGYLEPGAKIAIRNYIDYFLANDLDSLLGICVDMMPDFCNEPTPCFSTRLTCEGDGLLANACQRGSFRVAKMLIDKGYDINGQSQGAQSLRYRPLLCASHAGHLEIVKLLVNAKIKDKRKVRLVSENSHSDVTDFVNRKEWDGQTALHQASKHGHAHVVAFLIENGADVARVDSVGSTCLHFAACQNSADIARAILAALSNSGRPAYVNLGNITKITALHLAAHAGVLETVETLVSAGAKMSPDRYGQTPLMSAARNGHLAVVEYLLKVFKNDDSTENPPLTDWIDLKDKDGWTALSLAAWFRHESVVTFLASQGADIRREGRTGAKPRESEEEHELTFARTQLELLKRNGVKNTNSVAINCKPLAKGNSVIRVAAITGFLSVVHVVRMKSNLSALSPYLARKPVSGFRNIVDYLRSPSGDCRLLDCETVSEDTIILIQSVLLHAEFFQTALYRDGFCGHASVAECLATLPKARGFSFPQDLPRVNLKIGVQFNE